ncbi:MAG: hypothetical protein HY235_00530 [Acidobacteria bacterium]|nr:hypothetical protein [Acidobacteriota bacterium]
MVRLSEFCRRAMEEPWLAEHGVIEEQVQSVMGGISGLYQDAFQWDRTAHHPVETERAFVSGSVPLDSVLQEISNCSGFHEREASDAILEALESTLRYFVDSEKTHRIRLACLGSFEVADPEHSRYRLTFFNPSYLTASEVAQA